MHQIKIFYGTIQFVNLAVISTILFCCNHRRSHSTTQVADSLRIKELPDNYQQGKMIFRRSCETCHLSPELHATDQVFFDNLFEKLPKPSESYFMKFIQNSRLLKSSGDKYAQDIDRQTDSDFEHVFKDSLSLKDINNLIAYLKIATRR